jgi:hypothetical protein
MTKLLARRNNQQLASVSERDASSSRVRMALADVSPGSTVPPGKLLAPWRSGVSRSVKPSAAATAEQPGGRMSGVSGGPAWRRNQFRRHRRPHRAKWISQRAVSRADRSSAVASNSILTR